MHDLSAEHLQEFQRLFQRTAKGIEPGLDCIRLLLKDLGHPEKGLHVIHVAGTNGKGSVAAITEAVLRAHGIRTGRYTSPHLIRFNERFSLQGGLIQSQELYDLVCECTQVSKRLEDAGRMRPATFFEIATACAYLWFARSGVETAIVEAGMGGEWDATNVADSEIAVITNVAMDHMDYLGDRIEKIAWEKAGVLRNGKPLILGVLDGAVRRIVMERVHEKGAGPVIEAGKMVSVKSSGKPGHISVLMKDGMLFDSEFALMGDYQLNNCEIALAAAMVRLEQMGRTLEPEACKVGLETVQWPARRQMLQSNPDIIMDGAHNPSAMSALLSSLVDDYGPHVEIGCVFGCMGDKDLAGIVQAMAPVVRDVWPIAGVYSRWTPTDEIQKELRGCSINCHSPVSSIEQGWENLIEWLQGGKQRIGLWAGSLYLAGELLAWVQKEECSE